MVVDRKRRTLIDINIRGTSVVYKIAEAIAAIGGDCYFVGGCVRDAFISRYLFNVTSKDIDVEVFGITQAQLNEILEPYGRVTHVGHFGVTKLSSSEGEFDFTFPRRDNHNGSSGHRAFDVEIDSNMTVEQASERRDININAISVNVITGEVIDPFDGIGAIQKRQIDVIGSGRFFTQDPLRVLRVFQISSRFDMIPSEKLVSVSKGIVDTYCDLSQDRVREEWVKWASKSISPSIGLRFLVNTGWSLHFPEIHNLVGVQQEPEWHPEGDVFEHTCHVVDAMAQLSKGESADTLVKRMFSALCHDFGKPFTTFVDSVSGRIKSPAHDEAGVAPTVQFMNRLFKTKDQRSDPEISLHVGEMTRFHMRHIGAGSSPRQAVVRRLASQIDLRELAILVSADHNGRPFNGTIVPVCEMEAIMNVADDIAVLDAKPKAILTGDDLIKAGMKPSPQFGAILKEAFDVQLSWDGVNGFNDRDGALQWLSSKF